VYVVRKLTIYGIEFFMGNNGQRKYHGYEVSNSHGDRLFVDVAMPYGLRSEQQSKSIANSERYKLFFDGDELKKLVNSNISIKNLLCGRYFF
jgi:hypothetical protein